MFKIKRAEIYLLSEDEGGTQDGFDGMRPSFNGNGELILCTVTSVDGLGSMPKGNSYIVEIELPYGDATELPSILRTGWAFFLQNGGRVFGYGKIIAM